MACSGVGRAAAESESSGPLGFIARTGGAIAILVVLGLGLLLLGAAAKLAGQRGSRDRLTDRA